MTADQENENIAPKIVTPANKIRDKVTLSGRIMVTGNGFEPELLERAEVAAEGTRDVFLEAADQDLDRLQTICRLAENEPQNRVEHLKALQLVAHEIKGYGTNIGYDLLTRFGDSLSEFLLMTQADESRRISVARVHVDAMCQVFHREMTGDGGEAGDDLAASLHKAASKVK